VTGKSEEPAKPAPVSLVDAAVPSTAFPLLADESVFTLPAEAVELYCLVISHAFIVMLAF
jgi:hypothetical protein